MKISLKKSLSTLCFFLMSFFALSSQSGPEPVSSFISSDYLTDVLNLKECEGVRFYNVISSTNPLAIVTMSIGITADGSELYGMFGSSKKYAEATGVTNNRTTFNTLSKSKATYACDAVKALNIISFSASFSKAEIESMIKYADANGIEVTQVKADGQDSYEAKAAKSVNNQVTVIEGAPQFTCGLPCPAVCGDSSHYVNMK